MDWDKEVKIEARKQYLKYFRIWFILAGVLLVIAILVSGARMLSREERGERRNTSAPGERVYDYAQVLTEQEEQQLREYIARMEPIIQADIVLVTTNEYMGDSDSAWEYAMMNRADDFYDENNYGYDKVHGNGMLILDNFYEGQAGSWLSTCGNVYERFGDYEINRVLDDIYYGLDAGEFSAYMDGIDTACRYMSVEEDDYSIPFGAILILPTVVALVYALANLHQKKAADTTQATTYVAGGRPVMRVQRDDFIRKSVSKRRIQTSSSSGGGSHSSGRGGSHRSSSGVSHGGGGRRR